MYYVYVLKSEKSNKYYIGLTDNLKRRLHEHANPEKDQYTYRYAPWRLETYIVFANRLVASKFEKYLKTSSGRTFLKGHLVS